MSGEHLFGSNTLRLTGGLADVSVHQYGPAFLRRGGPIGRGLSEVSRGRSASEAAAIAAKSGKGHIAELRLASEHCLDAAIRDLPILTRPNPAANAATRTCRFSKPTALPTPRRSASAVWRICEEKRRCRRPARS